MTFSRKVEIVGGVLALLSGVLWVLTQMLPKRDDAALEQTFKSGLPKKIDDRTTLVDVDFQPYQVMDLKGTNVTFKYVIDLSVDNTPVDFHEMEQSVQQQTCANANTSRLIKEGDTFSFQYVSEAGVSLGNFAITTCP
jgi:hypothetical protein